MYAIAFTTGEGKTAYWAGGGEFHEDIEDAVQFPNKTLAEDTISLIYPTGTHNPGARVVIL